MISTDPISDMLTRIRNAILVSKREVTLPHSGAKEKIAQILAENNFIDGVKVSDIDGQKLIVVSINNEHQNARLSEMVRLSRPGRRMYVGASKIPTVKRGRGIVVISTSQGMMSGEQAKAKNLGGELICKVY